MLQLSLKPLSAIVIIFELLTHNLYRHQLLFIPFDRLLKKKKNVQWFLYHCLQRQPGS